MFLKETTWSLVWCGHASDQVQKYFSIYLGEIQIVEEIWDSPPHPFLVVIWKIKTNQMWKWAFARYSRLGGWAGVGRGREETAPLWKPGKPTSLHPSFLCWNTRGRIEDFPMALSTSKFCDFELAVVAFIKLFLSCYQWNFCHFISHYWFLWFEMFSKEENAFNNKMLLFYKVGQVVRILLTCAENWGAMLLDFWKLPMRLQTALGAHKKHNRQQQANSSLDQRINDCVAGTLIRPRGHV